ncbi:MAG: hypothetical protein Q9191_001118 [Dirinaria sp. TL-2023a]
MAPLEAIGVRETGHQKQASVVENRNHSLNHKKSEGDEGPARIEVASMSASMTTPAQMLEYIQRNNDLPYTIMMVDLQTHKRNMFLVPGKKVPLDTKHANHPVLGWTTTAPIDIKKPSTWPESRTQLTDFDIGRVCKARIPTRTRHENWPSTFDANGNVRVSRKPLDPPAIVEVDGELFVAIFKTKYRLLGDRGKDLNISHEGDYQTTYVNNIRQELIGDPNYPFHGNIPSLPTQLEFIEMYKHDFARLLTGHVTDTEDEEPHPAKRTKTAELKTTSSDSAQTRKKLLTSKVLRSVTKASNSIAAPFASSAPRQSISPAVGYTTSPAPFHVASPALSPMPIRSRTDRFAERYTAANPITSLSSQSLNVKGSAAEIFKRMGEMMGKLCDKTDEIDARFAAIGEDARLGQANAHTDVKDKVLSAVALFAEQSEGYFCDYFMQYDTVQKEIKAMSQELSETYEKAAEGAYLERPKKFYDTLTIEDDWADRLKQFDHDKSKA